MHTHDEMDFIDERDWQLQQKMDDEAEQLRYREILRRISEGVPVSKDDVIQLCIACGIDKRDVF
jgi:hypothetical protein